MSDGDLKFAVLGPGGVGGLVAAALHRAGARVVVIAREETAELISERGIEVRSVVLGDITAPVPAVPRLAEPVDVVFIATKAPGLDAALERVDDAAVEGAAVVPLLNGIEHIERLRERFGDRVASATIRVEADRPEAGRVVQTSPGVRVEMASERGIARERLAAIAAALEKAGISARVRDSERHVMWSKLTRLVALAATTSAYDVPIGVIRDDKRMREDLAGVATEASAVARADGADIRASAVLEELAAAHDTLGSSMQRDIAAGRRPEVDEILGAVTRGGRRHGVPTPTIERLRERIEERIAS